MPTGSDNGGSGKKSAAKANKAIKAAKKKSGVPAAKTGLVTGRQIPWLTVGAVVVVVGLIAVLAVNLVPKYQNQAELQRWQPTESNQDPSTEIPGIAIQEYPAALHVSAVQRVAYDQSPPYGGPHDDAWATCTGIVYPEAIRSENAVHSLEHGAVWITYNPDELPEDQVATLADKVDGENFMMMSPYPGLDSPVSLQSWGHQLKVDTADDERVDQFISALRLNRFTYPEVGATCVTVPGAGGFDTDNPPPFDPSEPGPDAIPMDGAGITPDPTELGSDLQLPDGLQLPDDLQLPVEPTPAS